MMNGAGWAMGPGDWLWMILVIAASVAVLVALVWLVVSDASRRQSATSEDAAHILKTRFARGDISAEEYEQARKLLGVSRPPPKGSKLTTARRSIGDR